MGKSLFFRGTGRMGLTTRLSIAMTGAILIGAAVLLVTSAIQEKTHFSRELDEYLNEEMNTLLITLAEPVVTGDYATIEKMLNDSIKSMLVEGITYADTSGSRIAAIDRPVSSLAPKYFIRLVNMPTFSKTTTITIGGRNYGTITLQLTTTPATNHMWSILVKNAQVLFLALALLIAVTTVIVRFSLRPLVKLAAGARSIGSGDYATRIPEQGSAEMVLTTSAFNQMAEQLRQTLDQLKQSRDRYSVLYNGTPALLHSIDRTGTLVEVNDYWLKTLGYERDEVLGRKVTDVYTEASRKYAQDVVLPAFFRDGVCKNIAYQFVKKNGELVDVLLSATGERDAAGNIVRSLAVIEDITERKRAEEALQKSEKMLHTIIDAEPECVKVLDENAGLIMMNRAGLDMIQADSMDQVRGQCVCPLVTSEYRPAFMELTRRVFRGESGTLNFEMIGMKGRRLWLETHAVPLRNEKNEITALLGVTRDITEHRRAEEALREKEEKYRLLFESANDGIFIQDATGFIDCNQKGAEMYGLTKEQVIGRSPGEFAPERQPDGQLSSIVAGEKTQAALNGVPQVFEWQPIRADGSPFDVEVTLSRLELEGAVCLQAIVRDISERKRLEQERLKTQKLEAIGTLAGGIAHDFNNLLQGIFGYILMAKITHDQKEKSLAMLEQAEQALHMSVNLTTQLLTFSKGGKPLKKKIALRPVIENSTRFALSGSSVNYHIKLEDGLWAVEADEGQIGQVVQNIVINADQAMPEGGNIEIAAKNVAVTNKDNRLPLGNYVEISIKDNGIGIARQYLAKIFDPYFTTKEKGSGLGLATSYSIISNHGGLIDVTSELGKGSTFYIYLPAVEAAREIRETSAISAPVRKGKILVMDDEEMIRNLASELIMVLGHDVELAENGEAAIEKYKSAMGSGKPFDIVILDLTIRGGLGGGDTFNRLRAIDPGVKAVVSSGYSDDAVIADYEKYGFRAQLAKPYKLKDLRDTLNELLS